MTLALFPNRTGQPLPGQAAGFFRLSSFHTQSFYGLADFISSRPPARVIGWQCCAESARERFKSFNRVIEALTKAAPGVKMPKNERETI
jgi:hypothetical protein